VAVAVSADQKGGVPVLVCVVHAVLCRRPGCPLALSLSGLFLGTSALRANENSNARNVSCVRT